MKNIRSRKKKNLNRGKISDNFLQIYIISYRKLKYWLGIYYLITFVLIVTIPANIDQYTAIIEYDTIVSNTVKLDSLDKILKGDSSIKDSTLMVNIPLELTKNKLRIKYPEYSTPFIYQENEEGSYFKKRKENLDFFSNILFGQRDSLLYMYYEMDSLLILENINGYGSKYEKFKKINSANLQDIARNLRSEMTEKINSQLDSIINLHLLDKFSLHIIEKFRFEERDQNKYFIDFESENKSKQEILNQLDQKLFGKIPYVEVQLKLKTVFGLLVVFYLLSPIFLILYKINYQRYDSYIINDLLYIPTMRRILNYINFNPLMVKGINIGSNILLYFLIPSLLIFVSFLYIHTLFNSIFLIVLVPYLIIVSVIFYPVFKNKKSSFRIKHK